MKKLFALGALLVLVGCSSQTLQPPKYYVLNSTPAVFVSQEKTNTQPVLAVGKINLSDYLRSSNLVLQVSDHELFFSTNHLWAEPLNVGIEKSLDSIFSQSSNPSSAPELIIDVQVDYFHIVDQDAVVLSGSYTIENLDKQQLAQQRFSMRQPLSESGYEYAVSEMSVILKTLGKEIQKSALEHRTNTH